MKKKKTVRGYKAFDKGLVCRDFQYELGKDFDTLYYDKNTPSGLNGKDFRHMKHMVDSARVFLTDSVTTAIENAKRETVEEITQPILENSEPITPCDKCGKEAFHFCHHVQKLAREIGEEMNERTGSFAMSDDIEQVAADWVKENEGKSRCNHCGEPTTSNNEEV